MCVSERERHRETPFPHATHKCSGSFPCQRHVRTVSRFSVGDAPTICLLREKKPHTQKVVILLCETVTDCEKKSQEIQPIYYT